MAKQLRTEENRRRFLIKLLSLGLLGLGAGNVWAGPLGKVPRPLPAGQSIYELKGSVTVNGLPANIKTVIKQNDTVQTGHDGHIVFVVGKDAFILRANSHLELSGEDNFVVIGMRLVTGALLSVFGRSRHHITTSTATIGIRGTGVYAESEPERSYVCTCYGTTEISALQDSASQETITAKHHDAPRYIHANAATGSYIEPAPFKNHTDLELTLIETLVDRTPPFALFDEDYGAPKRY